MARFGSRIHFRLRSGGDGEELPLSFDTEPIVGWRLWRVYDFERRGGVKEPRLSAVGVHALWHPRVAAAAECDGGYHEAPWPDCECGFWAFKQKAAVEEAAKTYAQGCEAVLGEVSLWGRVLECQNGWRAARAYPKTLTLLGGTRERADEIAALYGVPVTVGEDVPAPEPMSAQSWSASWQWFSSGPSVTASPVASPLWAPTPPPSSVYVPSVGDLMAELQKKQGAA
jgi:hypothetical protein